MFYGLFASDPSRRRGVSIVFRKSQEIIPYLGAQTMNTELLYKLYGPHTAPYAYRDNTHNIYTDGACVRGAAAMINQGASPEKNNAVFRDGKYFPLIVATRDIRNGEEIFVEYGRAYQMDEKRVQHLTRRMTQKEMKEVTKEYEKYRKYQAAQKMDERRKFQIGRTNIPPFIRGNSR